MYSDEFRQEIIDKRKNLKNAMLIFAGCSVAAGISIGMLFVGAVC
jgi:hypothetical protein|tara:strand:- start:731 stop:865 length:135 start_codon:yes stop_codon:yes gene_type:complete